MNLIESLLTLELSLEASSLLKDAVIKILLSSATDTSSTCVTIDGQPCKFPFKWNDVEYEACTKVDDKNDKAWCGTVSTVSGDGEWAHCDMSSACEGLILILFLIFMYNFILVEECTECVTTKKIPCVFPFEYKSETYNECTTVDFGNTMWCSTRTEDGVHVKGEYGECDMNCQKCKGKLNPKVSFSKYFLRCWKPN